MNPVCPTLPLCIGNKKKANGSFIRHRRRLMAPLQFHYPEPDPTPPALLSLELFAQTMRGPPALSRIISRAKLLHRQMTTTLEIGHMLKGCANPVNSQRLAFRCSEPEKHFWQLTGRPERAQTEDGYYDTETRKRAAKYLERWRFDFFKICRG